MVDLVIQKMVSAHANLGVRVKAVIFVRWGYLDWIVYKIVLYAQTQHQVDVTGFRDSAYVHQDTLGFTALIPVRVVNMELVVVSSVSVAMENVIT